MIDHVMECGLEFQSPVRKAVPGQCAHHTLPVTLLPCPSEENSICVPENKASAECVCILQMESLVAADNFELSLLAGSHVLWNSFFVPNEHSEWAWRVEAGHLCPFQHRVWRGDRVSGDSLAEEQMQHPSTCQLVRDHTYFRWFLQVHLILRP